MRALMLVALAAAFAALAVAQDSVMPNSVQQTPTPNSRQATPLPNAAPPRGFSPGPAPVQQIQTSTGSASVTVFSSTGPISTSSGPRVFFSPTWW